MATKAKTKKRKPKAKKPVDKKRGKGGVENIIPHQIKPGQVLNPTGRPTNQARFEKLVGAVARKAGLKSAEELMRALVSKHVVLAKEATEGKDFAALVKILYEYIYGKPKQTIEHTVPQPKDIILVDIDSLEEIKRLRGEIKKLETELTQLRKGK